MYKVIFYCKDQEKNTPVLGAPLFLLFFFGYGFSSWVSTQNGLGAPVAFALKQTSKGYSQERCANESTRNTCESTNPQLHDVLL